MAQETEEFNVEETGADNPFRSRSKSNEADDYSSAVVPVFDPLALYYDMSGDKYLIIFNHNKYERTQYFGYAQYSPREGTMNDVKSLTETFEGFGFKVFPHHDLTHDEILEELVRVIKKDHKNTSCVAVAVLTHGEHGGDVCASDRPYRLTDITNMLVYAKSLAGKPKLFFIQACRGGNMDEGQRIAIDGSVGYTIPTHADCLVLYSSFDDHLSYRDRDGSWMIQALCEVLDKHHEDLDILHLVTLVNQLVATRVTYTPSNKNTHNKKQMPETRFTLTKLLKFLK